MARARHSFTSPLRYPGGKGALSNFIKLTLAKNGLLDGHYAELYAGGAAIAWSLLFEEYVRHVHINDIDPAVYAFWSSVLLQTDALCRLILETPVTMMNWRRQHSIIVDPAGHSTLEIAFATFFLNRTNRSGIIRGGVIGGKAQRGSWKLDARFNKHDLISRIQRIARYSHRITLYNLDAAEMLTDVTPGLPTQSLLFLDPPYYSKGKDLYEHHYAQDDHLHISRLINLATSHPWIITYDSTPVLTRMYSGARRIRYDISYSAQARYSGSEVMFFSNNLRPPRVPHPAKITQSQLAAAIAAAPGSFELLPT